MASSTPKPSQPSPHAEAESGSKAELNLQASSIHTADEATVISEMVPSDKADSEGAELSAAPEATAGHAVLPESHVQTETGEASVEEAVEAEEEGWGELDNGLLTSEDSPVSVESVAGAVGAEQVPETAAGDVSLPEVEVAEEEESGWEGLEDELELQPAEETQLVEKSQLVESEAPAEETQAARPADAEVSVSCDVRHITSLLCSKLCSVTFCCFPVASFVLLLSSTSKAFAERNGCSVEPDGFHEILW